MAECGREVAALDAILERTLPAPGASTWGRRRMALASFGEDKKVRGIERALESYVTALTLHQSILAARRPDPASGPHINMMAVNVVNHTAGPAAAAAFAAGPGPGPGPGPGCCGSGSGPDPGSSCEAAAQGLRDPALRSERDICRARNRLQGDGAATCRAERGRPAQSCVMRVGRHWVSKTLFLDGRSGFASRGES